MAQFFTLRLITRQAGGGEIVRARRVDRAEVTVGRGAENDVVLTNLAVDLQHARIVHAGTGRVRVQALGQGGFLVDGRPSMDAELEVSAGAVLSFADFDVAVQPGEDSDETTLVVTRREEDKAPSASLFSLKAAFFGRRRMAWVLGLAIVAVCLLLPALGGTYLNTLRIHPDKQWSSGPLSKAHAFMEDDCQGCHQKAFVAVRDEACLTCHTADRPAADLQRLTARLKAQGGSSPLLIAEHADHDRLMRAASGPGTPAGMAKAVFEKAFNHPSNRCASCHLEHTAPKPAQGAPLAVVDASRPQAPALLASDCAGCHNQLKARLPDTALIDTPDWGRHPDFRPLVTLSAGGEKPTVKRVAISERPQDRSGLTFSHRLHLDPVGGVANQAIGLGKTRGYGAALECASCHRADKAGTSFQPIQMERDCAACHSLAFAKSGGEVKVLPHGDPNKVLATLSNFYGGAPAVASVEGERRRPGLFGLWSRQPAPSDAGLAAFRSAFRPGGSCVDCHTVEWTGADPTGVRVAPVHLIGRFMPRGAFDHRVPAHRGEGKGAAACADCHRAATSDRAEDLLMPDLAKCATCHGKTKAQTPAAASADCATCHSFHAPGAATAAVQDARRPRPVRMSWERSAATTATF